MSKYERFERLKDIGVL